jgi:L-alanine-DL-glutamate epimerase-like enolase superfamily enzyme
MEIVNIEIMRASIPFDIDGPRNGLRPGMAAWTRMESLLVRVDTRDGLSGWGEAFGHFVNPGVFAILESLVAPWFIGKDSRRIGALMEQAQRVLFGFGRNGPVMYALSALDIALWDIAAQRAGQPLYRLLGGGNNELRLYASLLRYGGDADAIARNAAKAESLGYTRVKLHEATLPAFKAAREATSPDVEIALDVNCPWSLPQARDIARAIRGQGYRWLEEPIWPPEDFSALAALRAEGVPIAGGENIGALHDFRRAFEDGALDIVQPSVVKVGGISVMLEIFALAKAFSVEVCPHCFYWGPGYLATAHLIAAMPVPALLETAFIQCDEAPHPLFSPRQSTLRLPEDVAGLGFGADADTLARHLVQKASVR